jgi:hypothetical protein
MYIRPLNAALRLFCGMLLIVSLALLCPQRAESAAPGEHQIKAAMVYNMMRFIDWPDSPFLGNEETLDICFVSKGSMSSAIEALTGKQVKGKTIAVRQVGKQGSFSGCFVLLLSDTERSAAASILDMTRSAPVMTVGDSRGFAASGGVFGFMILDGKVRFEINLAAAQRHRIRISAQLLKLAQNVFE